MPQITKKLLRKRAEHNEGLLTTLEEISLHQEEIEEINEVLGTCCRKIKILYLQNNIIPKIQNLFHLKDLQYLNLALNNIQKIEGLQNCEFLSKLDLTVNFIDFDELESSIDHLVSRSRLTDLYLMGNPSETDNPNFRSFVIAKLPQLCHLDGTEITKSMRILALQQLPTIEVEIRNRAVTKRKEKEEKAKLKALNEPVKVANSNDNVTVEDVDEDSDKEKDNELTEHCPEVRVEIYQQLAKEKKEKEDRDNVNKPKERDYEKEQLEAIAEIRKKEEDQGEADVKQKNEGGWEFFWDEESQPGCVVLDVHVSKYLDSSLIDVDVHPNYISIIIKSKTLRLRLPAEVNVSGSKCQRSKTTGSLMVIMPKINPKENHITIRGDMKAKAAQAQANTVFTSSVTTKSAGKTRTTTVTTSKPKKLSMQEEMLLAAQGITPPATDLSDASFQRSRTGADVRNIVKKKNLEFTEEPLELGPDGCFDVPENYRHKISEL